MALAGLLLVAAIVIGATATAEPPVIGPEQALGLAARGELTIVDIRRPEEWRQTGVPRGAAVASLHSENGTQGFVAAIERLTGGDKTRPLALICAGGVRSRAAASLLRARGYANVLDIREGMLGSGYGPGWVDRGLPVEPCRQCPARGD